MDAIKEDVLSLKYSDEALANQYYLYTGLNDINIFVEDEYKEYEYETIFKLLLSDTFTINKIFSTGGKTNLIKRFNEFGTNSQEDPEIVNIYIADGDFDRLIDPKNMITNNHFIYLEAYNIENYLIDKSATHDFIKGYLEVLDKEVEDKVNFDHWLIKVIDQSKELFLLHCCVKKYHPTIKNVARPNYQFIDSSNGLIRHSSIEDYKNEILGIDCDLHEKLLLIEETYKSIFGNDYFNLICGKFLFDSMYSHLSNISKVKFDRRQLRWSLVLNINLKKIEFIRDRILSLT